MQDLNVSQCWEGNSFVYDGVVEANMQHWQGVPLSVYCEISTNLDVFVINNPILHYCPSNALATAMPTVE